MLAYCPKCKKMKEIKFIKLEKLRKVKLIYSGICPDCKTKIFKRKDK